MKRRNLILTCCLFMVAFFQMAQENQNEQFLKNKDVVFKNEKGFKYTFEYEENQFGNLILHRTIEYTDGSKPKKDMFVADHEAFPVVFTEAHYTSDGTELESLKVLEKNTRPNNWRLVFIGDTLYELKYWNSKDDYDLKWIATAKKEKKGKGLGSGLKKFGKAFKEEMTNSKPTKEERKASLQKYLDAAFAKQAELAPAWEKENAEYLAEQKKKKEQFEDYVQNKNNEYWQSEEGQAKLREMRESEGKPTKWTVKNESSKEVFVGTGGSSKSLDPGQSTTFFCNTDIYYLSKNGANFEKKGLLGKGSKWCGKTYIIE